VVEAAESIAACAVSNAIQSTPHLFEAGIKLSLAIDMDAQPLVLKDFSGVPEITPDAYAIRKDALDAARPVAKVTTPEEQEVAVAALRKLKEVRQGMEASRKAVKAPVLELGRKIDAIAHDFLTECDKQEGRLQGMINHYQRKQLSVRSEQEDAIKSKLEQAQELRRQAGEAWSAGNSEEGNRLDQAAFDLEMEMEIAIMPGIDKPKGLTVRQSLNFRVTDPILFIQAYPQMWKSYDDNETLKVDRMRVREELNKPNGSGIFHKTKFPEELSASDDTRLVRPAGLNVFEDIKSHVR
jgi:hypothetical protein